MGYPPALRETASPRARVVHCSRESRAANSTPEGRHLSPRASAPLHGFANASRSRNSGTEAAELATPNYLTADPFTEPRSNADETPRFWSLRTILKRCRSIAQRLQRIAAAYWRAVQRIVDTTHSAAAGYAGYVQSSLQLQRLGRRRGSEWPTQRRRSRRRPIFGENMAPSSR